MSPNPEEQEFYVLRFMHQSAYQILAAVFMTIENISILHL
jgi:hypothetical protein